jgi:hypothetical protein
MPCMHNTSTNLAWVQKTSHRNRQSHGEESGDFPPSSIQYYIGNGMFFSGAAAMVRQQEHDDVSRAPTVLAQK